MGALDSPTSMKISNQELNALQHWGHVKEKENDFHIPNNIYAQINYMPLFSKDILFLKGCRIINHIHKPSQLTNLILPTERKHL